MILNVSDALRNPGQEYVFSGEQAIAPVEIYQEQVRFDAVHVEGTYFTDEDGNVAVSGNISTVAYARCANCLGSANYSVNTSFTETFIRNGDKDDDEIFAYEGYQVSLEKVVMSYVVLELPIRFLCKPGCKGLLELVDNTAGSKDDTDSAVQRPFAQLARMIEEKGG